MVFWEKHNEKLHESRLQDSRGQILIELQVGLFFSLSLKLLFFPISIL